MKDTTLHHITLEQQPLAKNEPEISTTVKFDLDVLAWDFKSKRTYVGPGFIEKRVMLKVLAFSEN